MKVGYVVSYDGKRGVGFIRAVEDKTYDAAQLSKHVQERAGQAELVMFRDTAVAEGVRILEGLKVRFELGEPETDEKSVWQVASRVELEAAEVNLPAPAEEMEEATEPVESAQAEARDVGFADEYEEGWDASSWDQDSWA